MPDEWKIRRVQIAGSVASYYWQGVLHVHDEDGFRRTTPFTEKRPDTFRVMVVGDSLTYGDGIDANDTFVQLLNDWLGSEYRVDFLNLGHDGYQSEDVLEIINKFMPKLNPDLVIYAICQNDFLPSGVGQYTRDKFSFPLPDVVKNFLVENTYVGAFLNDQTDAALRRLHLRTDFFDDILSNFGHFNERFRRDVAEMNSSIQAAGLPPLVAMVLDQFPEYGGRGYRITKLAEEAVHAARADLIPMEDYYIRYDRRSMSVSKWEGHPNEIANYIWANMLAAELRQRPDLQKFKR